MRNSVVQTVVQKVMKTVATKAYGKAVKLDQMKVDCWVKESVSSSWSAYLLVVLMALP